MRRPPRKKPPAPADAAVDDYEDHLRRRDAEADPLEVVRRAPDVILGSWCGRKFRPEQVMARPGWESVPAVVNAQVFEIKSSEILQPGPAALTDGVRQIQRRLQDWARLHA